MRGAGHYASSTTPTPSSTHFESSSRDTKVNDWEKSMLLERWHAAIGADPYSNPSLRYGEPRPGLLRRGARFARARLSR